jgi:hypothetical protein
VLSTDPARRHDDGPDSHGSAQDAHAVALLSHVEKGSDADPRREALTPVLHHAAQAVRCKCQTPMAGCESATELQDGQAAETVGPLERSLIRRAGNGAWHRAHSIFPVLAMCGSGALSSVAGIRLDGHIPVGVSLGSQGRDVIYQFDDRFILRG